MLPPKASLNSCTLGAVPANSEIFFNVSCDGVRSLLESTKQPLLVQVAVRRLCESTCQQDNTKVRTGRRCLVTGATAPTSRTAVHRTHKTPWWCMSRRRGRRGLVERGLAVEPQRPVLPERAHALPANSRIGLSVEGIIGIRLLAMLDLFFSHPAQYSCRSNAALLVVKVPPCRRSTRTFTSAPSAARGASGVVVRGLVWGGERR